MRVSALLVLAVVAMAQPAIAGRFRVLAASEVRVLPRVRSDRSTLEIRVQARDDHGSFVRGRVRLFVDSEGRLPGMVRSSETNERGEAEFLLPVETDDRVFHVQATFEGNEANAPSHAEVRVDLDAPFITIEPEDVPGVVDLEASALQAVYSVRVGQVVPANPTGWSVTLRADDRPVATAVADEQGRVRFRVPLRELGEPGVRTLRAEHARGSGVVASPDRRLVVRASSVLTLERGGSTSSSLRTVLVGRLTTRAGAIPRVAVRVLAETRVLRAALTNERGAFEVVLDREVTRQPDLVVRASFIPTEPWYLATQSVPLRMTGPAPRQVPWTWVAFPVFLACGLLGAVWLQRRASGASEPAWTAPPPAIDGAGIERVAGAKPSTVRVRLVVTDRATGLAVPAARAAWLVPALGERPVGEVLELSTAGAFSVEVSAAGYAPRVLSGQLPRGGEYAIKVAARSWREELFERVRLWMRQAGAVGTPALPTPREVLLDRGGSSEAHSLVNFVEQGVYGPEAPGADAIGQADALVRAAELPQKPC